MSSKMRSLSLWSFLRGVLSQGGDIWLDHREKNYEQYSARLDAAARERAAELEKALEQGETGCEVLAAASREMLNRFAPSDDGLGKAEIAVANRLRRALDESSARQKAIAAHDYPALSEFHSKHALVSLTRPSCLVCGRPSDWPPAIRHMELPNVVVCTPCRDAAARRPDETSANALDAAKWRALVGCQRISAMGSAGLVEPHANHYAHLTLNFWTVHPPSGDQSGARDWLEQFIAIAQRAQQAAVEPSPMTLRDFGYAPGGYTCVCFACGGQFVGDKHAIQCEPCARVKLERSQVKAGCSGGVTKQEPLT